MSAAERKRKQRKRDRELLEAGLTLCRRVIVPTLMGDYLRATKHMPMASEDDGDSIARGLENLSRTLLANADGEASQ